MSYPEINEDLIKISKYEVLGELPNPFIFNDGKTITDKTDWGKRRKEIYETAVELQYGVMPPNPEFLELQLLSKYEEYPCMDTYLIRTGIRNNPVQFSMTVMKPSGDGPFPAVIDGDMCFAYAYDVNFIRKFIDNGIMLVLFNRTELIPDNAQIANEGQLYKAYSNINFGAIAGWAWGYSRCVDALEKIPYANTKCITFTGHSRGAKTAILAGAVDQRALIVNPNETCAGGCGCYRLHMSAITEHGKEKNSETLKDIVESFPFWFNPELAKYADKENELPFDSHYLKSLIAPRVLFDSQAASDIWANPVGAWQTNMATTEVYKFLDVEDKFLWYFRSGYHAHALQDIDMLVNVILHFYKGEKLNDNFFKLPFKKPELMFEWKFPKKI